MPRVAGLPGVSEVGDVVQVERDEPDVKLREIEIPFPLVAGQCKELPISFRVDIIDGMRGRFRAARRQLPVMIAQNRQKGGGAEKVSVLIDQGAVGMDPLFSLFVKVRDIVSGGDQQMNIVGRSVIFGVKTSEEMEDRNAAFVEWSVIAGPKPAVRTR